MGKELSTSSFSLYTFSAAVFVQAVVLVLFSSFADHGESITVVSVIGICLTMLGPYRKKMLMICAYTGSVVSMLFIFVSPTVYYLAPILVVTHIHNIISVSISIGLNPLNPP